LASLVKAIDSVIEKKNPTRKYSRLRINSYVNFLGDDFEQLKTCAAEFGEKHDIQHVPLVVPAVFENGPERLKVHPDAEVTVVIYQLLPERIVKANHAFAKDSLDAEAVAAVVSDIEKHGAALIKPKPPAEPDSDKSR